jgi:hypothetical protein
MASLSLSIFLFLSPSFSLPLYPSTSLSLSLSSLFYIRSKWNLFDCRDASGFVVSIYSSTLLQATNASLAIIETRHTNVTEIMHRDGTHWTNRKQLSKGRWKTYFPAFADDLVTDTDMHPIGDKWNRKPETGSKRLMLRTAAIAHRFYQSCKVRFYQLGFCRRPTTK